DVKVGMYHHVAPFLSKLDWNGGLVGIRLRLGPASTIDDLKRLACAYCVASDPIKEMGTVSLAWSIDLLDFWLREPSKLGQVRAYKLDAENNPLTCLETCSAQMLDLASKPIDKKHLSRLIRVDFVAAQRGLGSEEAESRSAPGPHR